MNIRNWFELLLMNWMIFTFKDAFAAVGGPMVIAKVVDGSSAIKEQSILASLKRQGSICALVKLVAVLRVSVCLKTIRLRARTDVFIGRWLPGNSGITTYIFKHKYLIHAVKHFVILEKTLTKTCKEGMYVSVVLDNNSLNWMRVYFHLAEPGKKEGKG